ncbi:hypothetical protein OFB83_34345, partial [Escherichia coli]|nr:hypothetical protein [Escherichia coli]
ELSPVERATHEAMAMALGNDADGEQALRRAVALDPWAIELRDWLATQLATRGETKLAAAELEESIARYPYLVSHMLPE